jgi:hypothetical protein
MPSLSGAVRDMRDMKSFLVNAFNVPTGSTLDIRELKDKKATHANIIDELRKLKDDNLVKKNDAILIYYAGHGATMPPPEGWPGYSSTPPMPNGWPEDVEIQCIVASDAVVSKQNQKYCVSGVVLDRTLAALLQDLADKRGSNIVRRAVHASALLFTVCCLRLSSSTAATLAPVHVVVLYAASSSKTLPERGLRFWVTTIAEYGRSSLAVELWLTINIVTLASAPMSFSPLVAPNKRRQMIIHLRKLSSSTSKQPYSALSRMLLLLKALTQRNVFCMSLSIY